jgi:alpha-1,6-mannosyltransferase
LLAVVAAVLILDISFRRFRSQLVSGINAGFFEALVWCLLVYFLSTTILHPWYIITLLAISTFTRYRFPVLWTGVIFLTYAGYNENSFNESLALVTIEYLAVIGYILYETVWAPRLSHS